MASAAAAFDRAAADYDTGFGRNPIGLLFRQAFQERLRHLLPRGARVLDLGCGTGEDALALASVGFRVHGIDVAPEMVACARRKAASVGLPPERVQFEVVAAEDVARCGGPFDAAYSNFGALNCADLPLVGHGLAAVLKPGAPLLVSLIGPWPLPATLQRALTGRGERRRGSLPRVGGLAVAPSYPGPAAARRLLGEAFTWRCGFGLGIVVPDPDHATWAWRHPQAFGVLAGLERLVRRWPGLRNLGDHVVLEGLRR
jgi:ubiquinone/menaquinone biosynthesis C-methylase UbiE